MKLVDEFVDHNRYQLGKGYPRVKTYVVETRPGWGKTIQLDDAGRCRYTEEGREGVVMSYREWTEVPSWVEKLMKDAGLDK